MNHLSPAKVMVGVVLGVAVIQALMLSAFSWPASNSGPREVPIAVAGPAEAIGQIVTGLENVRVVDEDTPAFDVTTVDDHDAAVDAVEDRDVYGAVVVSPEGPELLVASGASPSIAQMLQHSAAQLSEGGEVPVTDVVPADPDDPNGAGLGIGVLPLVLTSAAGGLVAYLALRKSSHRVTAVVALGVVAGFGAAALMRYGLEIVDGSYWTLAGVIALIVAAVAAAVAGLGAVLGRAGAVLGLLIMIFIGNPLSAAISVPEMLPQPWGEIGQWLPPGAGISAVRSTMFFEGAALTIPLVALGAWLVGGLLLIGLGVFAGRGGHAAPDASARADTPATSSA